MDQNQSSHPVVPPLQAQSVNPPPPIPYASAAQQQGMTGRQTYNIVADTVVGANFRKRDNLIQLAIIAVFTVLGAAVVGGLALLDGAKGMDALGVALLGAFGGLVLGLIVSGIFLMIFRAVQHARGKHD